MAVSKERAMKMFNSDLERFMNEMRGLLAHYSIPDWEAYIFFRKPDCPESYVLKYEAAGEEFAERIVELHTKENTALREQLAKSQAENERLAGSRPRRNPTTKGIMGAIRSCP